MSPDQKQQLSVPNTLIWSSNLHPSPIFDPKYKPFPIQGWKPYYSQGRGRVSLSSQSCGGDPILSYQMKLKPTPPITHTLQCATLLHCKTWTCRTSQVNNIEHSFNCIILMLPLSESWQLFKTWKSVHLKGDNRPHCHDPWFSCPSQQQNHSSAETEKWCIACSVLGGT